MCDVGTSAALMVGMIDLRPIAEKQLEAEAAYLAEQNSDKRLELLDRADAWQRALDAAVVLLARVAEAEASGNPAPPSGNPDVRSEDA